MFFRRIACLAVLVAIVPACHRVKAGGAGSSGANDPTKSGVGGAGAGAAKGIAPVPIGKALAGSTVVLAKFDGRRIAFVADADSESVLTIDIDQKIEGGALKFGAAPGQMMMTRDGKLLVLTPSDSKLVVINHLDEGGADRQFTTVPLEPIGLATSADGASTYVTSGWGHALVGFDSKDLLNKKFEIDLPREPRGVVVSDDGKRVFISHSVGAHLSVVDVATKTPKVVDMRGEDPRLKEQLDQLELVENSRIRAKSERVEVPPSLSSSRSSGRLKPGGAAAASQKPIAVPKKPKEVIALEKRIKDGLPTCQSFTLAKSSAIPGRVFIPEVVVDPGEAEVKSDGYGSGDGSDSEAPTVAVLDEGSGAPIAVSMRRHFGRDSSEPGCLLPRASTIDDKKRELLVACQGIDALVAYDASSASPGRAELRRYRVGAGPTGVAIDPEKHQAVVWSQFDRTLSIIPLDEPPNGGPPAIARMAMAPVEKRQGESAPTALALGRILFHRSNDGRISSDGRSCASCHPDGRDDGLVWSTPEGPRRSIMLAGKVADTAPFSWQGNASTVQKHLTSTFQRLGGGGLEPPELEALVMYVKSLSARSEVAVNWRSHDGKTANQDDPHVAAGAAIFASSRAGCASCHAGTSFTDGSMHNVGSGRAFNTPSLLNVGSGGPWFHDGRYSTLGELLKKSDGKMGHTKHLKPEELANLEAFLRTL